MMNVPNENVPSRVRSVTVVKWIWPLASGLNDVHPGPFGAPSKKFANDVRSSRYSIVRTPAVRGSDIEIANIVEPFASAAVTVAIPRACDTKTRSVDHSVPSILMLNRVDAGGAIGAAGDDFEPHPAAIAISRKIAAQSPKP
jgi:hypothetical protein